MWREVQAWRGSPHASGAFWWMTAVLLLRLGLSSGIISCSFSPGGISFPSSTVVPYSSTPQSRSKQQCNSGSFPPLRTSWPRQASDRMIQTSGVGYIWIWVSKVSTPFANYSITDACLLQTVGFYYLVWEIIPSQQDTFLRLRHGFPKITDWRFALGHWEPHSGLPGLLRVQFNVMVIHLLAT